MNVYRPHDWVVCIAALDLLSGNGGTVERAPDGKQETGLHYTLLTYSDHDIDVSCDASLGSAQSSASSQYYPAPIMGASTGYCEASIDYPPIPNGGGTIGKWEYKIGARGPVATYIDPDNPLGLDGFSYAFSENDCNANVLGDDGTWKKVTLSDVF